MRRLVLRLPGVGSRQLETAAQQRQGRTVGARAGHPDCGAEVEASQPAPLVDLREQRLAEVHLPHHLEQAVVARFTVGVPEKQAADPQVELGPLVGLDQLVGPLLDPVVQETVAGVERLAEIAGLDRLGEVAVAGVERDHQPLAQRLPQPGAEIGDGALPDEGEGGEIELLPHAGAEREHAPRRFREPAEARDQQVDHVVGGDRRLDPRLVPRPPPRRRVEAEELLFGQGGQELLQEEGIAVRLAKQRLRQRGDLRGRQAQRLGDHRGHRLAIERSKHDLVDDHRRLPQLAQRQQQRVELARFVVAVGADDEQVRALAAGQELAEEPQRRRVGPLQVVEEQRQRVLLVGEHLQELAEHQLEAGLRFGRPHRRDRRLRADHQLELRDQLRDQLSVAPHGVAQAARDLAPARAAAPRGPSG